MAEVSSPDASALPLFSVIIPNWNGEVFLPTCLDALRQPTHEERHEGVLKDIFSILRRQPETSKRRLRAWVQRLDELVERGLGFLTMKNAHFQTTDCGHQFTTREKVSTPCQKPSRPRH